MPKPNQSAHNIDTDQPVESGTAPISASTAPKYELRVVRDFEEIESLRPSWERFQAHPNTDIDFYKLIVKVRPEILRPHIILISANGVPAGLVVGRIERTPFQIRLGYKQLGRIQLRKLIVPYGAFLGEFTPESTRLVTSKLFSALQQKEVELLLFSHLRKDTSLFQAAAKTGPWFYREFTRHSQLHWNFSLPATPEKFLADHYWVRRLPRRLEKNHPGKVNCRCFQKLEDVEQLCRDCEVIASKTYQRALGAGFIDNEENRLRMALSARKGWLRGFILYVDGVPWSFWIGTLYGKTFHSEFTGYDASFSKENPGLVVFSLMVQHLIREGIPEIDFGLGDSFYKKRFGNESWEESSVTIFAPTLKGCLLNATASSSIALSKATKKLLEKTQLVSRVKTLWRKRIRAGAAQEGSDSAETSEQKDHRQG